ncbi:MAG: endonuclease [Erysipelotrichales bacterium]|nr:endonuclease [Erysipelotrichales bacterium]
MKKRKFLLTFFSLLCTLTSFFVSSSNENEKVFADDIDNYYTTTYDVTGKKGDDLFNSLKELTTATHEYKTSYGDLKEMTILSDRDPSINENIILFYSRESISGVWDGGTTWNREHVWPKSLSDDLYSSVTDSSRNAGTDLHHIRPVASSLNSTRSNTKYGELKDFLGDKSELIYNNEGTGNYYIGNIVFEPRDDIKGDIARILMYLYTRYYDTEKLKFENVITTKFDTPEAAWDIILKWNEIDPVDYLEVQRNEEVAKIQGNRNPYIDHPEFINMIHNSNYSGKGALLDKDLSEEIPITSVSVSPASSTLKIAQTLNLTATILPNNATDKWISWSSSNAQVAKVDYKGKVTALKAGSAIITAKAGDYSATSKITVESDTVSYIKLESFNEIDETKEYVLGLEDVGFHYDGEKDWGKVAMPNVYDPYIYKLTKKRSDTFTASTIINGSIKYLTVPTNNTFTMSTTATELKLGTWNNDPASICNEQTSERHLAVNGSSGLRSYATGTGKVAYFYAIDDSESDSLTEEQAEKFIARLIALEGKVTLEDEETINAIEKDYNLLDNKVKNLVDEKGYASKLQGLKNELQALKNQVVVNEVIEAINALPNVDEIVDSSYYDQYYAKALEIQAQYNLLTNIQKSLVENIQKLLDVIATLEKFAPATTDKHYEFKASTNVDYPDNTNGTLEKYYTSLAGFKKKNEYVIINLESILKENDIITITVYSMSNGDAGTELTISGLYNQEDANLSQTIIPYGESVTSEANAKDRALKNPITVQLTIPTGKNIDAIKIMDTKHLKNVALVAVDISIQKYELSQDQINLNNLIELMNSLSTCNDYKRSPELRSLYDELSDESKAIFGETLCEEDNECSLIFKLEYMEYLFYADTQTESSPQGVLLENSLFSSSSILIVSIIAIIISISVFYIYYKKKSVIM